MAQKKQNIETANDNPFEPVTLDPPAPEIVRWQELAARDTEIYHGGDAEKIIPFPRPAWADPDRDVIGDSWQQSCYRSARVEIPTMSGGGAHDGEHFEPAVFAVGAKIHGGGYPLIGIQIRRYIQKEWHEWGSSIPPKAALELAEAIKAAVALFGTDR